MIGPVKKVVEWFEGWIDPLALNEDLRPPEKIWPYLWHYLRQAKLPFLAVLLLGGLSALLEALFFYYVGRLVDILDASSRFDGWQGLIAAHGPELAVMVSVVLLWRFLVTMFSVLIDEQVIGRGFYNLIGWQSYRYVSRQSMAFFSEEYAGSLVTKVSQAGGALGDFINGVIQIVWTILIFTLTTLVLFAQLDWRLAVVIVVWVVIFAILARYFLPKMRASAVRKAEATAAANGRIVDNFTNIQTVKLFGQAENNDQYVREGFERFLAAARALGRLVIGVRSSMTFLSGVMITAVAVICIDLWSQDQISVGAVAFALALVLRLNMWLGRLMGGLNGLMRNFGVVQNAIATISRPLGVVDLPDAIDWTPGRGHIRFEGVHFQYAPKQEIIEDLNIDIAPGEKVGLVGKSGAGKTTLVNLLLRFYDLESGRITIDDQDISRVKQEALRGGIGVVTQDVSLLHRTVRENILYGRPGASDEEVIAAAKKAGAHDFIAEITDRGGRTAYDARVGERGVKLSGGQRQRIAIARVILKDAPILILDEATSALDSEIEAAIQQQFEMLMQDKTVIAIAHRLSTIAAMDRLLVMDNGNVVEEGTHAELLKTKGHYARLWARQSGGFLEVDAED